MIGLVGESSHSLDTKWRLNIPTRFREVLGEEFAITKSLTGKCLSIYPEKEWKELQEKLESLPLTTNSDAMRLARFLLGSAVVGGLDKQGRVLIPASLREYAALDKEVTVLGVLKQIEIWDKEAYIAEDQNSEDSRESILESVKASTGVSI